MMHPHKKIGWEVFFQKTQLTAHTVFLIAGQIKCGVVAVGLTADDLARLDKKIPFGRSDTQFSDVFSFHGIYDLGGKRKCIPGILMPFIPSHPKLTQLSKGHKRIK